MHMYMYMYSYIQDYTHLNLSIVSIQHNTAHTHTSIYTVCM